MLINESLIQLNLDVKTRDEAVYALAKLAFQQNKISSVEKYAQAVLHRESEYSTAVGFGVAIPHGKTDAVIEPLLMFARVNQLDWSSLDGSPVDLIFMIGVPEAEAGSLHLKILAALSRKLMKEPFREALRNCEKPSDLIQVLKDYEIEV